MLLCLFCLRFKNVSLRYLAIYGVGTLMAYSIVHYKTPWCIISIVWPLFVDLWHRCRLPCSSAIGMESLCRISHCLSALAGWAAGSAIWWNTGYFWPFAFIVGAAVLVIVLTDQKWTYIVSMLALSASLGSTIWLNYFRCTTETEPYVYVQTYNDIFKLTEPVLALAHRDPIFYQMTGHIIRGSAYPLPWMLGDFPNVGYYENDNLPAKLDADFLLVQEDKIEQVEAKLKDSYYIEPLIIRSYQDPSRVYFSAKMFKEFFPRRPPDFTGHSSG